MKYFNKSCTNSIKSFKQALRSKVIFSVSAAILVAAPFSAKASGFALYEASTKGWLMGGNWLGKAPDASASYYNGASMTQLTGTWVTVGTTFEYPVFDPLTGKRKSNKMDAGLFVLPHFYVTQELPAGFTIGVGGYTEFGLGTKYAKNWPLAFDSTETTLMSYTINPNIAYKITPDWSISAGVRFMYISFEQYSSPSTFVPGLGRVGSLRSHLKGDNHMLDAGWVIGTQYQITKDFSVGAVYRSRIETKIKGHHSVDVESDPFGILATAGKHGTGTGDLTLPMSATLGFNWDATDKLHIGGSVIWTEWSVMDQLIFKLPTGINRKELNWHDSWRFGFGLSYEFLDNLSVLASYTYDFDPMKKRGPANTMVPMGDRHLVSGGLAYRLNNWEFSLGYMLIILPPDSCTVTEYGLMGGKVRDYKFDSRNSLTHVFGGSVTYHF